MKTAAHAATIYPDTVVDAVAIPAVVVAVVVPVTVAVAAPAVIQQGAAVGRYTAAKACSSTINSAANEAIPNAASNTGLPLFGVPSNCFLMDRRAARRVLRTLLVEHSCKLAISSAEKDA